MTNRFWTAKSLLSKKGFNQGRKDPRLFIQIEIAIGIGIEIEKRQNASIQNNVWNRCVSGCRIGVRHDGCGGDQPVPPGDSIAIPIPIAIWMIATYRMLYKNSPTSKNFMKCPG